MGRTNKRKKRGRKSSSTKSDKPKRGKTAYNYFCQETRPIAKEQCGDNATSKEVTSRLSELWKEFKNSYEDEDDERHEKAVEIMEEYNRYSADDKLRYEKEMTEYDYNNYVKQGKIIPVEDDEEDDKDKKKKRKIPDFIKEVNKEK